MNDVGGQEPEDYYEEDFKKILGLTINNIFLYLSITSTVYLSIYVCGGGVLNLFLTNFIETYH